MFVVSFTVLFIVSFIVLFISLHMIEGYGLATERDLSNSENENSLFFAVKIGKNPVIASFRMISVFSLESNTDISLNSLISSSFPSMAMTDFVIRLEPTEMGKSENIIHGILYEKYFENSLRNSKEFGNEISLKITKSLNSMNLKKIKESENLDKNEKENGNNYDFENEKNNDDNDNDDEFTENNENENNYKKRGESLDQKLQTKYSDKINNKNILNQENLENNNNRNLNSEIDDNKIDKNGSISATEDFFVEDSLDRRRFSSFSNTGSKRPKGKYACTFTLTYL